MTSRKDDQRFWLAVASSGLVTVLFLSWMIVRLGGPRVTNVMDNVMQLLAGLVATLMCVAAAHRHQQRATGWALLAASLFATECGNGVWCYYDIVRGQLASSSMVGDVCTALAAPLAIAALLTFPRPKGITRSVLRGLLDSLLIGSALFFVSWTLVLNAVYHAGSTDLFNLAYPASDIVVASLVLILATRPGHLYRVRFGLVSAGLVAFAVADSSYSYLTALHRYGIGSVTDTGWVLGYSLIALGGLWALQHPVQQDGDVVRPTVWTLVGPNLPLVAVAVVAAWQVYVHHALDRVSQLSFGVVVLVMAARQFLVLFDHLALSDHLESQVEERTGELQYQAFHDGLTGLANRARFNQHLETAIERGHGNCAGLAVLLIDLDNFKRVNDVFGHSVGDELLRLTATRLQSVLSDSHSVARVGGDEFAVLIEDDEPSYAMDRLAQRVAGVLSAPFAIGPNRLEVQAAVGAASGCAEQTTVEPLLLNAGLALSAAKAKGGNRYETYSFSMHSTILENMKTEIDMSGALVNHEFLVYYQPVVDLASLTIQGVEALVRWQHPTRGFLGPDKFIPVAEASGMIGELGAWVLGQACRDVVGMNGAAGPLWVSVNLSALQLEEEDLMLRVSDALDQSGLHPSRLTLEVTETVVMADVARSIQVLTALRNLGVKVAIDDFGTGYSSLGALRYLPVDTLKIDRSFVTDLARDEASANLTHRTLQLASDFHLHTVAEGVEEPRQLDILRRFGCESVQGFLFAKPQPVEDLAALLRTGMLPLPPSPSTNHHHVVQPMSARLPVLTM